MAIYVELRIRGDLETLWERTQEPALHERWDLRFTRIDYLPRADADSPQRFRYETRIGFGIRICGEGESTGTRGGADGSRTSALTFWSGDAKSLIRQGSGYWRYIPTSDGVRFLTWYDYRTRFGLVGRAIDRAIFRPIMGWATAWSFDRLRLWIERGIDPASSLRQAIAHAAARLALAFVFVYEGLVPKLIYRHATELRMLTDAGVSTSVAPRAVLAIGIAEVALGLLLLLAWRARWPLALIVVLMPVALVGVAISSPGTLVEAMNPAALNVAVAALALIAWWTGTDLPSARHCLRQQPRGDA
jgi:uncharacterized membrane protein YphA (DoxX/SURF4 family)